MSTTRKLADGRTITAHRNDGLRKRCDCPRRAWPKCEHDWHFNFKYGDHHTYRFSLDRYLGRRLKSKEEARIEAEQFRVAIRTGTFTLKPAPMRTATSTDALTFASLADLWLTRANRPKRDQSCVKGLNAAIAVTGDALGTKAIGAITEDDLEAVFDQLKARGLSASYRNHHVQAVKGLEKWARRKGYLTRPWLSDVTVIKREQHARRDRRLAPGEEAALLKAAGPWLQRFIIAAIETCCRRGELLALQWGDVSLTRSELTIRAVQEGARKTGKGRVLPISPRFRGVLEMVRHDPAGKPHAPAAFVFGDAIGCRVGSPATAWENAVLKAHGKCVVRDKKTHALSEASRADLEAIDLHFHDLRHEGGSRLLEAGWPLHHVQLMLGHANLSQTSTYLNVAKTGLQDSMKRFGTMPLHPVAQTPVGELSSASNDKSEKGSATVVN
jgi:integrase